MVKRKISKSLCLAIGFLLITCSLFMAVYVIGQDKHEEIKEETKIEEFFEEEEDNPSENATETQEIETKEVKKVSYSMIIEIPQIGLKKGLCSIGQWCNAVKYNIEINSKSDMPNITNGNLILAGHNGTSSISFFNKLEKLNNGDTIYIYYKGIKYTYKLYDSYDIEKNGKAVIKRDNDKTTLTLITCKKNTKDKQVVFISYLENKEEY